MRLDKFKKYTTTLLLIVNIISFKQNYIIIFNEFAHMAIHLTITWSISEIYIIHFFGETLHRTIKDPSLIYSKKLNLIIINVI